MLARETKGFREQTNVRFCNGPNDGNRSRVVFDDHLGARAHAGHQRGEVAHRFRFRDADYILSHNVIIHRDSSSVLTPEGRIYIASGTWDLLGSVAVTMVPGDRIAPRVRTLSTCHLRRERDRRLFSRRSAA